MLDRIFGAKVVSPVLEPSRRSRRDLNFQTYMILRWVGEFWKQRTKGDVQKECVACYGKLVGKLVGKLIGKPRSKEVAKGSIV